VGVLIHPKRVCMCPRCLRTPSSSSYVEWSGVEWSGVEWSGVEWSGVGEALHLAALTECLMVVAEA